MLEAIKGKKQINKYKWIQIYSGNKNLNFFTNDRIKLLLIIKSIKKKRYYPNKFYRIGYF